MKESIERYNKNLPTNAWPNYCLGNLDSSRVASRLGSSRVKAMNMILMLLQGTPLTYYGEEIGMVDAARAPMQWSADAQAGFTDGSSSWLSVNEGYKDVNVLKAEETENSALKIYREMTNLREDEAILFGKTNIFVQEDTFVLSRVKKGNPGYLLVSNLNCCNLNSISFLHTSPFFAFLMPILCFLDAFSLRSWCLLCSFLLPSLYFRDAFFELS